MKMALTFVRGLWSVWLLTQVYAENHPYQFERPLSKQALLTHKLGHPNTDDHHQLANEEYVSKYESGDYMVGERDRSSLGETEIRSRIISEALLANKSIEMTKQDGNDSHPDTSMDLLTSQSLPIPQSLRRKSQDEAGKLRNHNLSSKPAKRKPLIPLYEDDEEYDDDEYYYTYDEDDEDDVKNVPSPATRLKNNNVKPRYFNQRPNQMKQRPSEYLREPGGFVRKHLNIYGSESVPTSPPLHSPVTYPPTKPARKGLLLEDDPKPASNFEKRYNRLKLDRKSETELSEQGSNQKYQSFDSDDDEGEEYYDDFEVVEKGKRRSDGYGDEGGGINPLALLIAPLVGISLLTAAVAVALNPVLVSVSLTGRRRKRSEMSNDSLDINVQKKIHEIKVLEKFLGSVPEDVHYQQTLLSMYLSCSGFTSQSNKCLDRVVCEYSNSKSAISQEDRDVVSIVLYNIMSNKLISEDFKDRLRTSARVGRDLQICEKSFHCNELDKIHEIQQQIHQSNATLN